MNWKTILASVFVIAAVGAGGYYYYSTRMMSKDTKQAATGANAEQTVTDKVQAQDVKVGTGKEATPGSKVSVLYVGMLSDGTVFDSSAAHENKPLEFTLGAQGLIPGFQIGVNGMKEGGERVMAIPPSLGYGAQEVKTPEGKVIIPANSTIVFRVQLVKVAAGDPTPAAR